MDEKQIIAKKQNGDLKMVCNIMDLSIANVSVILKRPTSKRYPEVVAVLAKVIEARERAVSEVKESLTL
jgi:hypothetical protein